MPRGDRRHDFYRICFACFYDRVSDRTHAGNEVDDFNPYYTTFYREIQGEKVRRNIGTALRDNELSSHLYIYIFVSDLHFLTWNLMSITGWLCSMWHYYYYTVISAKIPQKFRKISVKSIIKSIYLNL